MKTCFRSSCIVYVIGFSLWTFSFAYQHSETDSTTITTEDSKTETNTENDWQSNGDEYIDESKYNKASYKYEQALLADIYASNRAYISMHDGRIHPSNFSYFTFSTPGTYRFILISLRGDVDIYISRRHKYVTYDNYEYSSCTCGIDEILIDYSVGRPIYIGIYGYSQYQISHYRLLIELVDMKISVDETNMEQSSNGKSTKSQQMSRIDSKDPSVNVPVGGDKQHSLWNVLFSILDFLVEVLA